VTWDHAFAGLWRTDDPSAIAQAVWNHDGTRWRVTDAMRGLFAVLWAASHSEKYAAGLTGRAKVLFDLWKGPWKRLKPGKTHIVVPPRPWVKVALADGAMVGKVYSLWIEAVRKAVIGRKKKARIRL
jgi:hypothetical protein